jgi:hypothetical protein
MQQGSSFGSAASVMPLLARATGIRATEVRRQWGAPENDVSPSPPTQLLEKNAFNVLVFRAPIIASKSTATPRFEHHMPTLMNFSSVQLR